MIESAHSIDDYVKMYPILRNKKFLELFEFARECAMNRAISCDNYKVVPLYSHDATYQSVFTKGWRSVSEQDIRLQKALMDLRKSKHEKIT
jgi:hypothetical protein